MRGSNRSISIPFQIVSEFDVPIVEFHISNNTYLGIIDTGAESTLFDSALRRHLFVDNNSEISIVGVSGEAEPQNIQAANAMIWMSDHDNRLLITNVKGYVNNISHLSSHFLGPDSKRNIAAIFGSDMLNNLEAHIDFKKKEIRFKI